jgi:DNA-binding transcriptional regulator LsrR (DeoR family)
MATYLPSPAIAGSVESAQVLREDPFVCEAMGSFAALTIALVDIGSLARPSAHEFSAAFTDDELGQLRQAGAVGEICLKFFDSNGERILNSLSERVIGIELDQLAKTQRCVAVSGGLEKHQAIQAALRGRLVSVLVTDRYTAEALTGAECT